MTEALLRDQMCDIGLRLWERGHVVAAEGNISVRLSPEYILCTPSGQSLGHLKPEDLVTIDHDGVPLQGGLPSSEIKMHLGIYAKRPDCQAVVHAHPPIATAFGLAGESIPDDLLPEAMVVLGSVANVPFCMPGTDDVPNAMAPFLQNHKTFLLCHHGAVTLGRDLTDAIYRMETLEKIAQIVLHATSLGGAKPMPAAAFEELKGWLNGKL